jgi:hypothetical protein
VEEMSIKNAVNFNKQIDSDTIDIIIYNEIAAFAKYEEEMIQSWLNNPLTIPKSKNVNSLLSGIIKKVKEKVAFGMSE